LKSIGIDIGSSSIKVAELDVSGKTISLQKIHSYPLTSRNESDRELEIITALKEASSSFNIDDKTKIVMGLPQDKASVRRMNFPFKEKFKILKSLPFEMEDLTPFSLEDSLYEVKVLSRQGPMTEVLAIALPKKIVSKALDTAKDCGLDPDILSLEGLALNNLFEDIFESPISINTQTNDLSLNEFDDEEEQDSSKKQSITEPKSFIQGEAILNIGHESSLLLVRANRQLQTLRRINWGSQEIVQSLAYEFNIQPKEAEGILKASKGILLRSSEANQKDQKVSEVITDALQKVAGQINLTLLEIKGSHSVSVQGLGLLGGMSVTPNIGARLTQFLKIPCNRILRIKNYPDISMNTASEISSVVAIGLAMEAAKRPSQPAVNFRRDEFSKAGTQFGKIWNDWNFHIKLASVSLVLFFVYAQIRTTLSEDLALSARRSMKDTAEKVLQIKKSQASEYKLEKLLKSLEERENLKVELSGLSKKTPSPLKLLKSISEKAPSRRQFPVDIKKLVIDSSNVQMTGYTKANSSEVKRFIKSLESLAKGKINSSTKNIRKDDAKLVEFSISFTPKKGVM